jgi:(p)ppGpp synthase/HD superfamily hydrolase
MTIKELVKKEPASLIARAYAFAEKAHAGQMRKSGEPYFNHPLGTAEILQSWHLDDATIAAGILHDTVEDTGVPLETIKKEFGAEVASLVDGVTKLGHIKYRGTPTKGDTSKEGATKKEVAKQAAEMNIAIDGSGNIWVTDQTNNRVQEFSAAGAYITQIDLPSNFTPAGVAIH